jgi:hypothetical protein
LRHSTGAHHHPDMTVTEWILILAVAALTLAPVAAPMLHPTQDREAFMSGLTKVIPIAFGSSRIICPRDREGCAVR